jgi:hypothetical protein
LSAKSQETIRKEIYDVHMSKSSEIAVQRMNVIYQKYKQSNLELAKYLRKQWFEGVFKRWKIYQRPAGYACTNSPIESYNSKIKKIYTKRKRLSVYAFIKKMVEIIETESSSKRPFHLKPKPSKKCVEYSYKINKKSYFKPARNNTFNYTFGEKTHQINGSDKSCSCSFYLKWMYCAHSIAFKRLFKETETTTDTFVSKPKRGKTKKATNCYSKD